jgi:hypothetical protein
MLDSLEAGIEGERESTGRKPAFNKSSVRCVNAPLEKAAAMAADSPIGRMGLCAPTVVASRRETPGWGVDMEISDSLLATVGFGLVVLCALGLARRSGQLVLPDSRPPVLAFLGLLLGAVAVIAGLAGMMGH